MLDRRTRCFSGSETLFSEVMGPKDMMEGSCGRYAATETGSDMMTIVEKLSNEASTLTSSAMVGMHLIHSVKSSTISSPG